MYLSKGAINNKVVNYIPHSVFFFILRPVITHILVVGYPSKSVGLSRLLAWYLKSIALKTCDIPYPCPGVSIQRSWLHIQTACRVSTNIISL